MCSCYNLSIFLNVIVVTRNSPIDIVWQYDKTFKSWAVCNLTHMHIIYRMANTLHFLADAHIVNNYVHSRQNNEFISHWSCDAVLLGRLLNSTMKDILLVILSTVLVAAILSDSVAVGSGPITWKDCSKRKWTA